MWRLVILGDLEMPKDFSILRSPNMCIANNGALNVNTVDKKGIIKKMNHPQEPWKFGVMLKRTDTFVISQVSFIAIQVKKKKYNFNKFIITKRMQSGWVLSINDKNIVLMKGKKTIKFDMVIATPDETINAYYFC